MSNEPARKELGRRAMLLRGTALAATAVAASAASSQLTSAVAQTAASGRKPNILFIMGDDIGWMQPGIYHEGLGLEAC
jgi:arylsulfatase